MYIWTCEINAPIGSILLGQLGHEDLLCNGLLSYRVNFGLGGIMFYKKPFTCKVHTGNAPIRDLQGTRWPMKRSHIRNWWAYQFRRIENQPHNAICKLGGSKSRVKERDREKRTKGDWKRVRLRSECSTQVAFIVSIFNVSFLCPKKSGSSDLV